MMCETEILFSACGGAEQGFIKHSGTRRLHRRKGGRNLHSASCLVSLEEHKAPGNITVFGGAVHFCCSKP